METKAGTIRETMDENKAESQVKCRHKFVKNGYRMSEQIQYMEEKNGPNYSALSHKALLLLHIMVIDGSIVMGVAHPPKHPLAQLLGATMPTQGTWIELFPLGLVGVGRREYVDNPRQIFAVLGIPAVLEFLKGGRRPRGLRGRRRLVVTRDCTRLGRGLGLAVVRVVSAEDSRVTAALELLGHVPNC